MLGPQAFGTWRFVNIFLEYLHFASLGTQPAMQQRLPYLRGRGDLQQSELVLTTVSATNIYSSFLYCVAVFAWSFFVTETSTANALRSFSPVILLFAWLNYTFGILLASGLYNLRSRLEILYAISTMLFSIALIPFYGILGAIAGMGIATLLTLSFGAPILWHYWSFKIDWGIFRELIIIGSPIMADIILPITMVNIDKILIVAMLNNEVLGIYSIGYAGVSILAMIPSAIGQVLFVKFSEMDGQNRTKAYIADVLDRTTTLLSSLLAPVLCIAIICFPMVIILLLPQYVNGIAAGKLLMASMFFLGISLPVSKWCISTGQSTPVLMLRLIAIVIELIAVYAVIRNGARLELIALCIVCAFAFFGVTMILVCSHLLGEDLKRGVVRVLKSVLPFLSIIVASTTQGYFFQLDPEESLGYLLLYSLFALSLSSFISVPFLIMANRRTRFADVIFAK
jgi:O-antigen/teichoic acid export membrane protein